MSARSRVDSSSLDQVADNARSCRLEESPRLMAVKRLSPLLIALAAVVVVAILRRSEPDAIEVWTPVEPS